MKIKAQTIEITDEFLDRLMDQYEEGIDGGRSSGYDPRDFDREQVRIGLGVEIEHTWDLMTALEIVLDHLTEFSDYYTRLLQMEKDAETGSLDRMKNTRQFDLFASLKVGQSVIIAKQPLIYIGLSTKFVKELREKGLQPAILEQQHVDMFEDKNQAVKQARDVARKEGGSPMLVALPVSKKTGTTVPWHNLEVWPIAAKRKPK
jgi:hypothetical protein